jgi:predicted DNA-binding transcriptional regulator YafY
MAKVGRLIAPYGLVAKANVWYLVYALGESLRAIPVSNVLEASISNQPFDRPTEFDLPAFWESWCNEFEMNRPKFSVTARISPMLQQLLPHYFGRVLETQVEDSKKIGDDGWIKLTLPFESFEEARDCILGFGRAVEVLEPIELRESVIDFANQIVDFYSKA